MVYRAALGQVQDRTVAEDIAGQVFLEAVEGIGRYRDRGKDISAWLLTMTRHRCIDWRRKQQRVPSLAEPPAGREPSAGGDEAERTAFDVLSGLTPEQSEVLTLRFIAGYSIDEVARLTGRTPGAVKQFQRRALIRARQLLQDPEGGKDK